jgi:hypothetical protein
MNGYFALKLQTKFLAERKFLRIQNHILQQTKSIWCTYLQNNTKTLKLLRTLRNAKHASIFYFGMCLYGKNTLIIKLGTDHLTCRGGYGFLFHSEFFFRTPRELEFFFSSEFNIRLYDKNSESDYLFFLHQNH